LNEKVRTFILKNEHADPFELSLKYKEVGGVPIKEVAQQIAARKKAKLKLPTWYACDQIVYPAKVSVEQSSSDITANYKASLVEGTQFIDLTGGMGVDSWALSKKFEKGIYLEQQKELVSICKHNFNSLGVANIAFKNGTAQEFLSKNAKPFDLIYLDPARRDQNKNKVFKLEDCTPNAIEILPQLLKNAHNILIKTAPLLDIRQTLKELKNVAEVHIVSVQNECKEVLYLLNEKGSTNPLIKTINYTSSGKPQQFDYYLEMEASANVQFGELKSFLYEPNSSIMKAGAFKAIAEKFSLIKLHQNTHLYTSETLHHEFPGRKFEILGSSSYSKKGFKKLVDGKKANIAVRNFPDNPEKVKKKLGLKDGGENYVFACRLFDESMAIINCRKFF